jgi:hypothetical protein
MIIKRICPQTGIANFFVEADPFIARSIHCHRICSQSESGGTV